MGVRVVGSGERFDMNIAKLTTIRACFIVSEFMDRQHSSLVRIFSKGKWINAFTICTDDSDVTMPEVIRLLEQGLHKGQGTGSGIAGAGP